MGGPSTGMPTAIAAVAFSDPVDQHSIDRPRRGTTTDARTRRVHFSAPGVRR